MRCKSVAGWGGEGKCFLCQQIKRIFTAQPWSILSRGDAVIGLSRKMGRCGGWGEFSGGREMSLSQKWRSLRRTLMVQGGGQSCSGGSRLSRGSCLPGMCDLAELQSWPQLLGVGRLKEIRVFPPSPCLRFEVSG